MKNDTKKPNPITNIITDLTFNSILYKTKILAIKQIIPLNNGNKYRKESSIGVKLMRIYN